MDFLSMIPVDTIVSMLGNKVRQNSRLCATWKQPDGTVILTVSLGPTSNVDRVTVYRISLPPVLYSAIVRALDEKELTHEELIDFIQSAWTSKEISEGTFVISSSTHSPGHIAALLMADEVDSGEYFYAPENVQNFFESHCGDFIIASIGSQMKLFM